ncbi:MAG TPA: hypothetical protein VN756_11530, partial [Solirubrobacterales bacterium]|nr:hypothetical protein [Solirubrobacterales bacterium]
WLATFVVPLILAMLLLGVKASHAAPLAPDVVPLAFEEELEADEEGEFEESECETAEEEFEEGELGEVEVEQLCEGGADKRSEKAAANSSVAPEECLLRSARARVVASDSHRSARLTVGYTTYEPTGATIDYSLKGGKGTLRLGTVKRHLGRSGVIRLTETLGDSEMAKVEAAGRFTVRLHIANAPGNCRRFETEQLTVKRATERQTVWSQTD